MKTTPQEPTVPSSGTVGQPELTIIDRREIPICGGIVVVETRSDGAMLVDGDLVEPVEITAEKMFNESKASKS